MTAAVQPYDGTVTPFVSRFELLNASDVFKAMRDGAPNFPELRSWVVGETGMVPTDSELRAIIRKAAAAADAAGWLLTLPRPGADWRYLVVPLVRSSQADRSEIHRSGLARARRALSGAQRTQHDLAALLSTLPPKSALVRDVEFARQVSEFGVTALRQVVERLRS